jgi:hypothetical protein
VEATFTSQHAIGSLRGEGGRVGEERRAYPVLRCLAMREILISKASSSCCRCLVARIQMLSQKKGARVLTPVIKECRRICAWM